MQHEIITVYNISVYCKHFRGKSRIIFLYGVGLLLNTEANQTANTKTSILNNIVKHVYPLLFSSILNLILFRHSQPEKLLIWYFWCPSIKRTQNERSRNKFKDAILIPITVKHFLPINQLPSENYPVPFRIMIIVHMQIYFTQSQWTELWGLSKIKILRNETEYITLLICVDN